jgi:hypothetical protein
MDGVDAATQRSRPHQVRVLRAEAQGVARRALQLVALDADGAGEHVMRAMFTHCAIAAETVSLWLRVRDDCTKLDGRIGLLPERRIRVFEARRCRGAPRGRDPALRAVSAARVRGPTTIDCS